MRARSPCPGSSPGSRRSTAASRRASGATSSSRRSSWRAEGFERDEPRAFLHLILEGILLRDEGGSGIYGDPARVQTQRRGRDARARSRCRRRDGRRAPPRVRGRPSRVSRRSGRAARGRGSRANGALDAVAGRRRRPADPRAARCGGRAERSRTRLALSRTRTGHSGRGRCPARRTSPSSTRLGWRLRSRRRWARDPASFAAARSSTTCSASST